MKKKKKIKSKTKGRKNRWMSKRNCLTFVTVCNCHLISIESLCFVVSYKLCACADINISLYQSIYRIFIHIVDFSFSVSSSLYGTICPIHFHYQTNRIESNRSTLNDNTTNWIGVRPRFSHQYYYKAKTKMCLFVFFSTEKTNCQKLWCDMYSCDLLFYESSFRSYCVTVQYSIVSWWANRIDTKSMVA